MAEGKQVADGEEFDGVEAVEALKLRNVGNEPALSAWLGDIASERLSEEEIGPERSAKAKKWLMSVARKRMLKEGELADLDPADAASYPTWVAKALSEGKRVDVLRLTSSERRRVESVMDWMGSSDGPAVDSDWSRISWAQAVEFEARWVDEMGKRAKERRDDAALAAGTWDVKGLEDLGEKMGEDWRGWSWVQLGNEAALRDEGARMHHCVGIYGRVVAEGTTRIYSLRDKDGKSKATVEAFKNTFRQLKGPFDAEVPDALLPAVRTFGYAMAALPHSPTRPLSFGREFDKVGLVKHSVVGWMTGKDLSPEQQELLAAWKAGSKPSDEKWGKALAEALAMGNKAMALELLPKKGATGEWMAGYLTTRWGGFESAAKMGDAEVFERLLSAAPKGADIGGALLEIGRSAWVQGVEIVESWSKSNKRAMDYDPILRGAALSARVDFYKSLVVPGRAGLRPRLATTKDDSDLAGDIAVAKGGSFEIAKFYVDNVAAAIERADGSEGVFKSVAAGRMLSTAIRERNEEFALSGLKAWKKHLFNETIGGALTLAARQGCARVVEALLDSKWMEKGVIRPHAVLLAAVESADASLLSKLVGPCNAGKKEWLEPIKKASSLKAWGCVEVLASCRKSLDGAENALAEFAMSLPASLDAPKASAEARAKREEAERIGLSLARWADDGKIKDALIRSLGKNSAEFFGVSLLEMYGPYKQWKASGSAREGLSTMKPSERRKLEEVALAAMSSRSKTVFGLLEAVVPEMSATGPELVAAIQAEEWDVAERLRAGLTQKAKGDMKLMSQVLELALDRKGPSVFVEACARLCAPEQRAEAVEMAAKRDNAEAVGLLMGEVEDQKKLEAAFKWGCYYGNVAMVDMLMDRVDPAMNHSEPLREACRKGKWEVAATLLPVSNPGAYSSQAFLDAAKGGQLDLVEAMLGTGKVDPTIEQSAALSWAAKAGDWDLVKLLLPVSDPMAADSQALYEAVASGHVELVKLLAPLSDPNAKKCRALRKAVDDGMLEILNLIIPITEPEQARLIIKLADFEAEGEAMLLGLVSEGEKPAKPRNRMG